MSQGDRRLAGVLRNSDAEIVTRYRKAGLVLVGKTSVPEFGLALGPELVEAAPPMDREPLILAFMRIIAGETRADIEASGGIVGRALGFAD